MGLALKRTRLSIAIWMWARVMPIVAYRRDLQSLMTVTAPPKRRPYAGLEGKYVAKRVRKITRNPWFMRDRPCLRDGVLAYRFLKLAGYEPELHFGVDRSTVAQSRLGAHCWVVLEGEAILNPPHPNLVEIVVYGTSRGGIATFWGNAATPGEDRIAI